MVRPKKNDMPYDFRAAQARMIRDHLAARGIACPRVLEAFRTVPRHAFIDPVNWDEAYADHPVGIACGQTISQPYIVALMTELLDVPPGSRVLEVGTGSGYQTAILAAMGARVSTIERHEPLTERAAATLQTLDLDKTVSFFIGDGSLGLPERAPFDRIIVTAAAPEVPPAHVDQLAAGGRMVIPAGSARAQRLHIVTKTEDGVCDEKGLAVIFVPLVGEAGFHA